MGKSGGLLRGEGAVLVDQCAQLWSPQSQPGGLSRSSRNNDPPEDGRSRLPFARERGREAPTCSGSVSGAAAGFGGRKPVWPRSARSARDPRRHLRRQQLGATRIDHHATLCGVSAHVRAYLRLTLQRSSAPKLERLRFSRVVRSAANRGFVKRRPWWRALSLEANGGIRGSPGAAHRILSYRVARNVAPKSAPKAGIWKHTQLAPTTTGAAKKWQYLANYLVEVAPYPEKCRGKGTSGDRRVRWGGNFRDACSRTCSAFGKTRGSTYRVLSNRSDGCAWKSPEVWGGARKGVPTMALLARVWAACKCHGRQCS